MYATTAAADNEKQLFWNTLPDLLDIQIAVYI